MCLPSLQISRPDTREHAPHHHLGQEGDDFTDVGLSVCTIMQKLPGGFFSEHIGGGQSGSRKNPLILGAGPFTRPAFLRRSNSLLLSYDVIQYIKYELSYSDSMMSLT